MFNVNIMFGEEDIVNTLSTTCSDLVAQTCRYFVKESVDSDFVICNAKFEKDIGTFKKGSHSLTMWTYFVLRTLMNVFVNVVFNISDGAASTITIRERSNYAVVHFFGIVGPIVNNLSFGTDYWDCLAETMVSVNDFKIPFFIQDGVLVVIMIIVFFFLDVDIEKKEKKLTFKEEFQWLLNPAAIGYFLSGFVAGVTLGCVDTYLFVFAQETLGASTTFLGYMNFAMALVVSLLYPLQSF